jgi:hypothetical protein
LNRRNFEHRNFEGRNYDRRNNESRNFAPDPFIHRCLCVQGMSMTPHPNVAKGLQKLFKALAPHLTVLGIPHFF